MLNIRLAGGHLYGKQLFTLLSLVVSLIASCCAVLFPTRCHGWDLGRNSVSFRGISYLVLHCKLTLPGACIICHCLRMHCMISVLADQIWSKVLRRRHNASRTHVCLFTYIHRSISIVRAELSLYMPLDFFVLSEPYSIAHRISLTSFITFIVSLIDDRKCGEKR